MTKNYSWFVRGGAPSDDGGLTRKKKLREAQREAETFIANKSDEWLGQVLKSQSGSHNEYANKEVMCSAYDCSDFDIPIQSAQPPAEKYDYSSLKVRKWFNPKKSISMEWNPLQDLVQNKPSRQSIVSAGDIHEIRPQKTPVSLSRIASPSCVDTSQWDPTDTFSIEEPPAERPPKRRRFLTHSRASSFNWENRNPAMRERNRNYQNIESAWISLKSDEAFHAKRIMHLASREESLSKLREKMKQRFQKALVHNEPFARKRFDEYLKKYFVTVCRKSGRRCNMSLEKTFIDQLNATINTTTPLGDTVMSLLSLKGKPSHRNELSMKNRARKRGSMLIPAPPAVENRRDSSGRLLPASKLRAPRPATLLSENSEKIVSKMGRRKYSSTCELSPSWELTPNETIMELDNFDSRITSTA
eukprot:TRINITY_DN36912_c0_g1_i1.p1 TRINITY_DN36912_c0_g1~~TRINITY_DN36912_c0_g1_i1.p1  ORF type:complete len:416 (+),score=58.61 TRINITY_DN36912_c0_g1_i1:126-1373(+)